MEQDGSEKITLSTGEEVLYSGNENKKDNHTKRVAIMLSKKAKSSLLEWESYNAMHQATRLKRRILTYLWKITTHIEQYSKER